MRVTVCQLSDDPAAFDKDWKALAEHVEAEKSDLVLLPEMPFTEWFAWRKDFDAKTWKRALDAHGSAALERLVALDRATVAGTRPMNSEDGKRHNVGFVWDSKSGSRELHIKGFLPDEEGVWEASWYEAGAPRFDVFDAGSAKAGFLICTEIWFPEYGRDMGLHGAQILLSPRRTDSTTIDKWLTGGRASAIISGCFSLSSNSVNSRNTDFGGGSWVIDPNGNVLALTDAREPFVTVKIDLEEADRAKETYPRYVR